MPQDFAPSSLPLQEGKGFSRSSSNLSSLEGVWLPRKREKKRENEKKGKEAGALKASRQKEILLMKKIALLQCLSRAFISKPPLQNTKKTKNKSYYKGQIWKKQKNVTKKSKMSKSRKGEQCRRHEQWK